jgi:hypothetical protein
LDSGELDTAAVVPVDPSASALNALTPTQFDQLKALLGAAACPQDPFARRSACALVDEPGAAMPEDCESEYGYEGLEQRATAAATGGGRRPLVRRA